MQLAVALSESMQQESLVSNTEENKNVKSNAFNVLMTPKVQKHTKRKTR